MKKKILFILLFAIGLVQTGLSQVSSPNTASTLGEGTVVINKIYNSTIANGADDAVEILVVQDHTDLRSLYLKDFQKDKNGGALVYFFKEIPFFSDMRAGTVIVLRNNATSLDVAINPEQNDFNLDIGLLDRDYMLPANASSSIFFDVDGDNMMSLQKNPSGTNFPISILGDGPRLDRSFGASIYFRLNDPTIAGAGTFVYVVNSTSTINDFRHSGATTGYVYDADKTKSNVILNNDPIPIPLKLGEPNNLTNAIYINSLRDIVSGPSITAITPTSETAGNTVNITGINFSNITSVKFGGVEALSFTVVSVSQIAAVVGVGASGDVSVTNARSTATFAGFTYIPAPVPIISSFSPTTASPGDAVVITGTNLNIGTSAVKFGGVNALSYSVINATTIEAIVDQNSASGEVSVTTFGGTAKLAGFNYVAAPIPVITSFTPTSAGENATVTINGTGFLTTTGITFGGKAALSFAVVTSKIITAVVGKGISGDVVVTSLGGVATKSGFNYSGPIIASFSPQTSASGATITITGKGFTGATGVSFGNVAASSFQVVSATSITAVVGPGASGNVTVTTPLGSFSLAGYVFIPAPIISSFTPVATGKGNTVIINGQNFTGTSGVTFGGVAATSFVLNSATKITAIVGTGATGSVAVVTPGGTGSLAGFTFILPPTITAFTPKSTIAGATVTITGTNFTDATAVKFGGINATSYTVVSATSITAKLPLNALSGAVSVTTLGGEASLDGFIFILPPIIKSVISTYASEGSSVKITGLNFDDASDVRFGGTRAKSYKVLSPTVIVAVVGEGSSGSVTVTTVGGTATLPGFTFIQGRGSLIVQNVLTPNGDGKNDKWIVENLSLYPVNKVKIFNDAGKQVYAKDYYDNEWDGTDNGAPLPAGNYMYVIILSNNLPSQKGYITIIR